MTAETTSDRDFHALHSHGFARVAAATPLVATITVVDIYAVSSRVRQDTFIVYEPLLLLAVTV